MENGKRLVIIGGGITGLSSGITWSLNMDTSKNPVTILEKQPKVGGYVTTFGREGYIFDTSQILPYSKDILDYFQVDLDLVQFEGYFARIFIINPKTKMSEVIEIPSGLEAFKDELQANYPDQSQQIEHFFKYTHELYEEVYDLKVEPNLFQILKMLKKCPKTIKNISKTFKEYFDSFGFTDPELIEVFDVFAAFSGLPAERVAAILTIGAMNTTLDGAFRPAKGFNMLPHKMAKRFEELGGTIRRKTKVEKILTKNGHVKGVRLTTGEIIDADYVITTIDPMVAMKNLVGMDTLKKLDKKYAQKVDSVKMSTSTFSISLGLDDELDLESLGLKCGYNVVTTGKGTFEKLFKAFDKGELGYNDDCFHTAVICPSLITGGKPAVIIRVAPAPIADWVELRENDYDEYTRRKNLIANFFIQKIEDYVIPDLSKHILVKDISTPATFARYSGSPSGANYDMMTTPDNVGPKRLKMRTPVNGLFQPKFFHGIWPALQGGMQAVDMILEGKVMNGNSKYRA